MTIVAANWVGENTSTVGTGSLALSGAISTFCPFSVLPDGSEVYYTLQEGFNRETGIGVVSNGTLTRKVQATLVAGVYTETDIPISLSGNGQVFAVINADFMTRIYNFSLDVADSVSAAAASAKSSSDSASLANDYKTQSAQAAENAAAYAQSASNSKSDATASKNAAAASASAAASSQADALASKNAAASSQAGALASQNAAKTSETNSKNSETASAQSATNASNSAASALASQNAAKTSENNASESKTAAKTSETNAKTSETNAKTSEVNAKTSETNAKTSEINSANSANAAAASAALARQYQPNTALQLFTTFVNATAGNTMNDKLADGVYPVTADSTGAPLAVDGKVWVTHRGTNIQQTWESQVAAGDTNYGRKFFRTGVDSGSGVITWGNWREHVFMELNGITKVLRGVDSTFTLGADGAKPLDSVSVRQMQQAISAVSSSSGINGVMSTFIGSVDFWPGNASNIPTGYMALSGGTSNASDFPEIIAMLTAGTLLSVPLATWTSDLSQRGKFGWESGSTTFRWPDYNGGVSGSVAGLFLRGTGGPADAGTIGNVQDSAAPNIFGSIAAMGAPNWQSPSGSFTLSGGKANSPAGNYTEQTQVFLNFDARNSNSTYGRDNATEVRPRNVVGTWIMRAKGTFSARTSFAVMLSVASNPVNSSTVEGGKVRSTLVGPSGELGGVDVKYRHIVNASGGVSKQMVLGVTGANGEIIVTESGALNPSAASETAGNLGFSLVANDRAIIQTGGGRLLIACVTRVVTPNNSGCATVPYDTAFTSTPSVVACSGDFDAFSGNVSVNNMNKTYFQVMCIKMDGTPNANASVRINYIAIGRID